MLASDLCWGGRNTVPLCQRKWSSEKLRCLLKILSKTEVVVKCFVTSVCQIFMLRWTDIIWNVTDIVNVT